MGWMIVVAFVFTIKAALSLLIVMKVVVRKLRAQRRHRMFDLYTSLIQYCFSVFVNYLNLPLF